MSNASKVRGDQLECAVREIERAILSSSPGFNKSSFRIEGNKIIVKDGVRHEFDVFVTAEIAPGYSAIFVFECKNLSKKVGKNDIIVFSKKIDVVSAQRGFFVARSFSRHAIAQAALDPRITLLSASDVDPAIADIPFSLVGTEIHETTAQTTFLGFRVGGVDDRFPIEMTAELVVDGRQVSIQSYVEEWASQLRDARVTKLQLEFENEGMHTIEFGETRTFERGRVTLDSKATRSIELACKAQVYAGRATIVSAYDIKTRGRHVAYELNMPNSKFAADLIMVPETRTVLGLKIRQSAT